MLWNEFDIAEFEALWPSHIKIWGVCFMTTFSVFSAMAEWIAEILFMLFFAYTAEQENNIAEYEAYWLISVPINKYKDILVDI